MKRYLLLFLAFTASFAMTAQDYVINPNPAHVDGFTNEGIVKLSSTKLFNNSADTSALKWRRVVVDKVC